MRLDGRTALVTGSASGIGRAIALQFARQGACVIGIDIDAQKAAEVGREAASEKLAVEFVAIDLTDVAAIGRGAAELTARCPRLDILVNAAGWDRVSPFVDNAPEFIERIIALNLGGPVHFTRALLPTTPATPARSSMSRAMRAASAAAAKPPMRRPKAA